MVDATLAPEAMRPIQPDRTGVRWDEYQRKYKTELEILEAEKSPDEEVYMLPEKGGYIKVRKSLLQELQRNKQLEQRPEFLQELLKDRKNVGDYIEKIKQQDRLTSDTAQSAKWVLSVMRRVGNVRELVGRDQAGNLVANEETFTRYINAERRRKGMDPISLSETDLEKIAAAFKTFDLQELL
ncbi:MAG: hypothetical protein KGL95_16250, partial [Patescibacteria group bacterium]|nr:hypothetical protein [Patescibacteria group bacterium]